MKFSRGLKLWEESGVMCCVFVGGSRVMRVFRRVI